MQDTLMHDQTQPFVKLALANMDLISRFSTSPEVTAQATADASRLFQQASQSSMKLLQSGAFATLMQGLLKNYTGFLAEFGQGSMAMLSQAQAAMTDRVQQATHEAIDAADGRGRRAGQAA